MFLWKWFWSERWCLFCTGWLSAEFSSLSVNRILLQLQENKQTKKKTKQKNQPFPGPSPILKITEGGEPSSVASKPHRLTQTAKYKADRTRFKEQLVKKQNWRIGVNSFSEGKNVLCALLCMHTLGPTHAYVHIQYLPYDAHWFPVTKLLWCWQSDCIYGLG